jgi:hypothetical protein
VEVGDRKRQDVKGQPMVRFIPAKGLKDKYGVFGHFYSVQVSPTIVVKCRSVLEIVENPPALEKTSVISSRKPDAVFIMMNPGSSRPLTEVSNHIHAEAIHELLISLVPTKPDTTQYQVMRVMHYCEWRHVRVLNLSDLRCSLSGKFFKQFKQLEEEVPFDSHSVFSPQRKHELALKLTKHKTIPVICAWGVSPKLDPLIERCISKIGNNKTIGLLKNGTTNKYLHPLPSLQKQKLSWVNRMVEQCQG